MQQLNTAQNKSKGNKSETNNYQNNLVSIITPAYNAEKYIAETIESVLAQTYSNWEMLIVNDCSTDNTAKIVQSYADKDKRIKLINLTENSGAAIARNTAIQNAKGRYIAFLDSDDLWKKEKLQKQLKFMQQNGYAFTFHDFIMFNDGTLKEDGKLIKTSRCVNYIELLKGNNTGGCLAVCIDKEIVDKIFMPNEHHEDYICWLNILRKYNIQGYGLNEVLGYYRVGKKSVSSNKIKSAVWTWNVYRKVQKLSILQSIYYMCFYIMNGIRKHR
ncbi:MAG: glycosyl transferase [Phascolarctobacterium sp.]|nr:MAG: glycosyl transferase [Phascolarctobacterium sp.]